MERLECIEITKPKCLGESGYGEIWKVKLKSLTKSQEEYCNCAILKNTIWNESTVKVVSTWNLPPLGVQSSQSCSKEA